MSEEESVQEEKKQKTLAQEAYKRKEYDTAETHYFNAMAQNPKEMSYPYHIGKIYLEQELYSKSISLFTMAIKRGKENKANVKMVAKAMAMRGRAHKGLGEEDKFKEDIEKAVKFLTTIANVKFGKERWEECIEFCQKAYEMGKENDFIDAEVLVLQSKATARLHAEVEKKLGNEAYKKRDFESAMKHYLKATELYPTEVTFLNNIAAVKLEQKKYKECLDFCIKAIEVGKESGADSKKIQKALDRQERAQKLLDETTDPCWHQEKLDRLKEGIQEATDIQGLTVDYNTEKKEFTFKAPGVKDILVTAQWVPKDEEMFIEQIVEMLHDSDNWEDLRETAKIPATFDPDNFSEDLRLYFIANNLDPKNMSDLYSVMEKLFEKGNYKGCDTIGRNTLKTTEGKIPIKGRKFNGVNNRILKKMRKLRGTALRRIYGLDEDFDAKLSQLKREDNHATAEQVRHMLAEVCQGRVKETLEEAENQISAADIDGDRKVTLEQCYLVFHTTCQKMVDNFAEHHGLQKKGNKCLCATAHKCPLHAKCLCATVHKCLLHWRG